MTDNELLLAISNMMDVKLEPVTKDIQGMKEDINGIKEDINGMKEDINGMKKDIDEVKDRVKNIELTQENKILPRLNTIEACYTSTYDRYKDSVGDYEAMKQDISILKKVVAEHSEKLQKIG